MLRHEYGLEKRDGTIELFSTTLGRDYLLLDCPPELDQDNLVLMALSDARVLLPHPATGDLQDGAVMIKAANRLGETGIRSVLNDVPESLHAAHAREEVERAFHCLVGALQRHSATLMLMASRGVLADHDSDYRYVIDLKHLLNTL